jgi:hypothetical protein
MLLFEMYALFITIVLIIPYRTNFFKEFCLLRYGATYSIKIELTLWSEPVKVE